MGIITSVPYGFPEAEAYRRAETEFRNLDFAALI
jgi:hypothetical protein